jgi:hypothetical protein
LQQPLARSKAAVGFQQFAHKGGKIQTPQEQAQRILQPINPVATFRIEYVGSSQFSTSAPIEPQLQAAQILNHNLGCRPLEC